MNRKNCHLFLLFLEIFFFLLLFDGFVRFEKFNFRKIVFENIARNSYIPGPPTMDGKKNLTTVMYFLRLGNLYFTAIIGIWIGFPSRI